MPERLPFASLEEAALALVRRLAPDKLPACVEVVVKVEGVGVVSRLIIPPSRTLSVAVDCPTPPPGTLPVIESVLRPPRWQLNEKEQNILEALGESAMTGQEIADRAGYALDSDFRDLLAAMRRHGVLTGGPGDKKYSAARPTHKTG